MFDLSKAIEFIGTGLGGTSAMAHQGPNLADLLGSAGIDPALLSGLSESDILSVLSEHGIDPAAIAGGQLDELLANLPQAGGLADELASLQGMISDRLRS